MRHTQLNPRALAVEHLEVGGGPRVRVADLKNFISSCISGRWNEPIHSIDLEFVANEFLLATDDNAPCFRINVHDVTRRRESTRQTFSLTDSKELDTAMFCEEIPIDRIDSSA